MPIDEPPVAAPALAFGPYRLSRHPLMLCRDDVPIRLGGRALDLLVALTDQPGAVLSRSELEARVWPHSVVEDSSLRVHIGALRKALGDGVDGARYIANVPGRGYSFVADLRQVNPGRPDSGAADPSAAPAVPVNNLPSRLTTMIGREAAVAMLAEALPRHRITTIVGHGGIGKTSLALALAAQLCHAYPDGACFVDLAPLTQPWEMVDALALALGLPAIGDSTQLAVETWLRPRGLLLILDNCEHLLDATVALLDRILRVAPGIDALATSREPLDADGEWVHRLGPLDCPPANTTINCADALRYSALRLLVERAMASQDTFELNEANVSQAVALCRRLDGVPLALEFAAARIGALGLQGIVGQLDDRLRLLGSGRRTVLPRHRTLGALLDWSYDLLSLPEQCVLRRCSVFRGSFTLESACEVIADQGLPAWQVSHCLLALVDKSLVVAHLHGLVAVYSQLEITRAYGSEKLHRDPDEAQMLACHARHLVVLMTQSEHDWERLARPQWLLTYLRFAGDIRAALDWAFGPAGDPQVGVALTASIMVPTFQLAREDDLRLRARQALAAIDSGTPAEPRHEMRIRSVLAHISPADSMAHAPLQPCYADALDRAQRQQRHQDQIEVLYHQFSRMFSTGNYRSGAVYAERAGEVARDSNDVASVLHSTRMRCQSAHFLGHHAAAASLAQGMLERAGEPVPLRYGSPVDRRVSVRIVLARCLWLTGHGVKGTAMAAECLDFAAGAEHPDSMAQALCLAAIPLALWRGDTGNAQLLVEQLVEHAQRHATAYWLGWAQHFRHLLALPAHSTSGSASLVAAADHLQIDHFATFAPAMYSPVALERAETGLVGWSLPEVLRAHGEQLLQQGGDGAMAGAEQAFMRSLELADAQQALAWSLRSACSLARLWQRQGREGEARRLLAPLYSSYPPDPLSADLRLAGQLLELSN